MGFQENIERITKEQEKKDHESKKFQKDLEEKLKTMEQGLKKSEISRSASEALTIKIEDSEKSRRKLEGQFEELKTIREESGREIENFRTKR